MYVLKTLTYYQKILFSVKAPEYISVFINFFKQYTEEKSVAIHNILH